MGLKFMATLGASRTTTCDFDQHWQADVSRGPPQNALVLDESEFIETIVLISKGLLEARKLVTWSDSLWQRGFEYITYLEFGAKNDVVYNSYMNLFANTSCNKGYKGSIQIWVAIRIFTARSS